ncbi:MAG: SUMF1/EgtB/PvdO family nonheme iron enzyme [Thermoguttaceae bacterium]|nr:SUMF1/EgtB/PvdO family nonheme iron enzyme [Thermoguttaceae bacterium]
MAKFYALVVGVDTYKDDEFRNLEGATRDARELAKFFRERLPSDGGYRESDVEVVLLENPTSEEVRDKFHKIVNKLDNESVFVFYFAGHGLCLAGMNQPSLLCIDAMGSLKHGGSSAGEISPQFVTVESRTGRGDMLFIFDVCRTEVFVSRGGHWKQKGMKGLSRNVTNKKKRPRGTGRRCTLSSCSDGEEANDRGYFLKAVIAEWGNSLAQGQGLAVGYEYVGRVKRRLEEYRCWQSPDFEGDSFTLTSAGLGDRLGVRLLCAIKRAVVPAVAGIVFALVVLAAIWLLPKLTTLGRDDGSAKAPPREAPVVARPSELSEEDTPALEETQSEKEPAGPPVAETAPVVAVETESSSVASDSSSVEPVSAGSDDVDAVLNDGFAAYDRKEYKAALDCANSVLSKEPENAGAKKLAKLAGDELANELVAEGTKRLESGQADDAVVALDKAVEAQRYASGHEGAGELRVKAKNAALSAANSANESGDYNEGRRIARAVLDVVKTDGYATIILNEAQSELDKKSRISTILTDARRLMEDGKLDASSEKVGEALTLDPYNADALKLKGELESRIIDNQFAGLLVDVSSALENQDYDAAQSKLDAAQKLRPNHPDVSNLQNVIKKRRAAAEVAQLVQEGREALKKGDLALARSKADSASRTDAENKDVKALLADVERAENQALIASLLKEAQSALAAGDYQRAQDRANAVLPKDFATSDSKKEAESILATASKKSNAKRLASEGEALRKSGKLSEAASKAQEALKEDPNCQEAKELQTRLAADRKASENVWANSSSRKAGTRQTLKIGDAEYGFCWIPAGEFDMGSPTTEKDRGNDETLHHVKLTKGFWMLETETPQSLYEEVMGSNPSYFKGKNLPVEEVSWEDAQKFCAELAKRLPKGLKASLPTEAQWEYSCRSGSKTAYSFGDELNGDKANCDGNYPYGTTSKGTSLSKTSAVKSYAPNAWGLYDMHGNVREWCLDYYGAYPTGTAVDPRGPNTASYRVVRGGGWYDFARLCRSAIRLRFTPDNRYDILGFRFLLSCD